VAHEVERRARVALIGYAGGGVRNIFSNKPATNMARAARPQGPRAGRADLERTFQAIGMSPSVIAYNEVYNAIQNNVIEAGENEAAGVEQMRFYEVAPNLIMTQHAITIRPLCFSTQTLAAPAAPSCRRRSAARAEAGVFGRQAESTEDGQKVDALERAGRLRRVEFTERAQMKRAVDPVMAAYAREIDAERHLQPHQRAHLLTFRAPGRPSPPRPKRPPPTSWSTACPMTGARGLVRRHPTLLLRAAARRCWRSVADPHDPGHAADLRAASPRCRTTSGPRRWRASCWSG
jgi:hypothetical protein